MERARTDNDRRPRGLVIAIVILAMVLAAVSMLALNFLGTANYYQTQLENQYQRSFYDLASNMSDLEIKLSKLLVTKSQSQLQRNLNEVSIQTESTQQNLATLPTTQESIYKTMKFVNQLGDYSTTLLNKIARGNTLSESDYEYISSMYETNKALTNELKAVAMKLGKEIKLVYSKQGDTQANPLGDTLTNMQDSSVNYPQMIYDGPFSDSILNSEIKGLNGAEVSKEEAQKKAEEYFSAYKFTEIKFLSETVNKNITTYNYNFILEDNKTLFVQMSKKGGILVTADLDRLLDNYTVDVEGCIKKAEEFAKKLGYNNLTSVWASDYNGFVYVNLAPLVNNVIYYPDLIKIVIARDNGMVTGAETISYLTNHTERTLSTPAITAVDANNKISSKIEIVSRKLALIPRPGNKEALAYEFAGTWNDMKYFVYIDASTGEELDVFRVIDSSEGTFVV